MKKILAFIICLVLVLVMPLAVFAEDGISDAVVADEVIEDTLSSEDETVTEGENTGEEDTPEPTLTTEMIGAWFEKNSGALGIVCTIIGYGIALFNTINKANKSVTTMNNNTVTISESNEKIMSEALKELKSASALLGEIRRTDEDRKQAEKSLAEVSTYLNATRMANVELANEVAELLVLANIPNSKKEELYSRHLKAVAAIAEAEKAAEKTEVKEDVEQEA